MVAGSTPEVLPTTKMVNRSTYGGASLEQISEAIYPTGVPENLSGEPDHRNGARDHQNGARKTPSGESFYRNGTLNNSIGV